MNISIRNIYCVKILFPLERGLHELGDWPNKKQIRGAKNLLTSCCLR